MVGNFFYYCYCHQILWTIYSSPTNPKENLKHTEKGELIKTGGLAVNWRQTAKENKWLESYISEESLQIFLLFLHFSAVFQQYSRVSFLTPPKSIQERAYTWPQGSHQCERDPFRFSGLVQAGVLWKHCLYQKRRLWYIFHMVGGTGERQTCWDGGVRIMCNLHHIYW